MSAALLPPFTVEGVTYTERPVTDVEEASGMLHVFTWTTPVGRDGFVVVRRAGRPKLCSCPVMLCAHRAAVAEQLRANFPEPVA